MDHIQKIQKFNLLLIQEKFREAKRLLEEINKTRKDSEMNLYFGWLYDQWALTIKNKDKIREYQNKARNYFEKALKPKETKLRAIRALATLLMHQKNYKESLELYKKSLSLGKDKDFHIYNDLGNIYQKLKKNSLAFGYYQKALKMAKNDEEKIGPLYNLIQLSRKLNKDKQKAKYLKQFRRISKRSLIAKSLLKKLSK